MERLSVIPQEKEASARKRGELESGRKILEGKRRTSPRNRRILQMQRKKYAAYQEAMIEEYE